MNREEYLEMRRSGKVSLEIFYRYYVDNIDTPIDYANFMQLFPIFFSNNSNKVVDYLDKKFNIVTLLNVEGNEIGVV